MKLKSKFSRKKPLLMALALGIVIAGVAAVVFSHPAYQDSHAPFPGVEGAGTVPLPPKTYFDSRVGLTIDAFVSGSTNEEIKAFYDGYFATLKPMRMTDGSGRIGYLDEKQGIVYIEVIVDYSHFSGNPIMGNLFTIGLELAGEGWEEL